MKQRHRVLAVIFALSLLLAFLQHIAFENFLYWRFWWYDVMMHFLGGVVLGSVFYFLTKFELPQSLQTKYLSYNYLLLFVLVIGVIWEVYEYTIGIDREYSRAFWAYDSTKDLLMDILGGSVAYWIAKRLTSNNGPQ